MALIDLNYLNHHLAFLSLFWFFCNKCIKRCKTDIYLFRLLFRSQCAFDSALVNYKHRRSPPCCVKGQRDEGTGLILHSLPYKGDDITASEAHGRRHIRMHTYMYDFIQLLQFDDLPPLQVQNNKQISPHEFNLNDNLYKFRNLNHKRAGKFYKNRKLSKRTCSKIMSPAFYFSRWHHSEITKSVRLCFSLTSAVLQANVLGARTIST